MTTLEEVIAVLVDNLSETSSLIGTDGALVVENEPPDSGEVASPYAYVQDGECVPTFLPNNQVRERAELIVRFILDDESPRLAARRMRLWKRALTERYQTNLVPAGATLDGTPRFSAFSTFGPGGAPPYGFEFRFFCTLHYVTATRAA